MVSQEELTKLIDLVDKLDSTGKQAARESQYGGYVTAVYYNGRLHESSYETPECDEFYSDPIENQLTNQIIIFLLEQSHIPLNNEAWWF